MLTICCVIAMLGQVPPAEDLKTRLARRPPDTPEYLQFPGGVIPTGGGHDGFSQIPLVIDVGEWEQYAKFLRLTKAQKEAMAIQYDQYRRSDWEFRQNNTQSIFDRSSAWVGVTSNDLTPEIAAQQVALRQEAERVAPDVRSIELEFLAQVRSVLSDEQLTLFELVRLHRDRVVSRMPSRYPAYTFDLDEVLYEMDQGGLDITPRDRVVFEDLMRAWRAAADSAYKRHAELFSKSVQASPPVWAAAIKARKAGQRELDIEMSAQYFALRGPPTKAARQIFDLNQEYVSKVADQLPPASAERLLDEFEKQAFKQLHPDPCDLTSVFAAAEQSRLTDEQRAGIAQIRNEWEADTVPALARMQQEYLAWHDVCWDRKSPAADFTQYCKRMSEACDRRISRTDSAVNAMLEVLTEKQRKKIDKEVRNWREGVATFREEQAETIKIRQGWPSPFE